MNGSVAVTLAVETVRMSVPYACAVLAGIWSEKSGVVNIALEGVLLAGAFVAAVAGVSTGSPWLGAAAAAVTGAAIGALHAGLVRRGVDAIVSGMAINLAALGGSRFLLRALFGSSSNSPPVPGLRGIVLPAGAPLGALVEVVTGPLVLLGLVALGVTRFALAETRFGIRVRAAGESPASAASLGLDVGALRLRAVSLGGAIGGLGGAALAFDEHQFQSGMSGGRGFIALAAVIVAGRRPGRATLVCAAFALLDSLQIVFQGGGRGAHDLLTALPYVATLVSLALVAPRRRRATLG
jgi:simple sugar transport system permease protein